MTEWQRRNACLRAAGIIVKVERAIPYIIDNTFFYENNRLNIYKHLNIVCLFNIMRMLIVVCVFN